MNIHGLIVAGAAALIVGSPALADFTVWTFDVDGTTSTPGPGYVAVRIYADFSDPGDRLLSVIGADYTSMTEQSLWQDPFNPVGVEPAAALLAVFPDLQWTSFVTIGHTQTVVGEPTTSLDPDGEWTTSGFTGGYFVPGDAPQGLAGSDLKVLIAQLSVKDPGLWVGVQGTATIAWEAAGIAGGGTQFSEVEFAVIVDLPAPATLALLSIAGLASSRRRG